MGRTPAAIPDRLSMMTELPDLDDFHDDAIRLAVLLLGRRGEPAEAEILLVEQALRGQWHNGWVAHAQSIPRRRAKTPSLQ
jgi:hypothetical protein